MWKEQENLRNIEQKNLNQYSRKQEKIYLVIPAYEPDGRLIDLLRQAAETERFRMIVVNDGSSRKYDMVFEEAEFYATVLNHLQNQGKGSALKTAFQYIQATGGRGCVVTADADGQHTLPDILSVAEYSQNHPGALVLGKRTFTGKIPVKSRLGNLITRQMFRIQSGQKIMDTQTGLRAFSTDEIPFMLNVTGERYEYEMNVLLFWAKRDVPIREIPIETIYLDNNRSSHFRPVQDAVLIYKDLFKFGGVSVLSFLLDYLIYGVMTALLPLAATLRIIAANTVARCISGGFNFEMNRRYVFEKKGEVAKSGAMYLLLAVCIYLLSTGSITFLYSVSHWNLYILKICVDLALFLVSWYVQKHVIFKKEEMVLCDF